MRKRNKVEENSNNSYIKVMKSIVITPKTRSEWTLLSKLLRKLKIDATYLTQEEKEDLGIKTLMREADRKKVVSKISVMKKLNSA